MHSPLRGPSSSSAAKAAAGGSAAWNVRSGRLRSPFVRQKLKMFVAREHYEVLQVLNELIEAGKITPVIDRTYPLSQAADAIRYLEKGHARGKVVITV